MIASGKLTLTSKKPRGRCPVAPRRPVKDCYCRSEVNETRSWRTRHKSASPRRRCQGELELGPDVELGDKAAPTSPISCETLRRVRKIDYAPRSQFLRNVQSKICELRTAERGDCLRSCPRSSCYHRFMTGARTPDTIADEKTTLPGERERFDERREPPTFSTAPANSLASERSGPDGVASCKRPQVSPRKLSKSTLRKTIRSRRQIPESGERPASKSPTRGKRAARLHKQDCPCCCRSELERKSTRHGVDKRLERRDLSEYRERGERCLRHDGAGPVAVEDFMEREMENLRQFREQNYFETHGSSHTLTSSGSSGSLQQYLLNERLFPEPVGRIRKQDLVVTMPACATTQKRRVHYFPRYVVRQEKNACNTNYRRKRCQSCPLTGHAIDLGVLKARPPLNSLALKYQKRVP
ncbi:PREDICTED: uncharacterized protein LOC105559442 [Vollenhovia emeryi]|uniref:uncharacterized protein LOC105559442 n=1 Tax=Vollenhovia emeryi TaxID=411798 RepID=UPI0005F3F0A6|nr:PREDICTED: uncharacterized protein LOC105559442 [Vollenhovia emeryi]XP_011863109.1 PREDICTED: uncharacterized protein LOC105559442 [Vollenhovia emeryi]XP_011863110.1 PREDICTED: uncharacterized protein LOC105559442 [Vollenhovia emeryi]XP_011863111.1 PREDICTED: uncharacterized protein LOC105559442 [Vollenhovia emeryi]XP_011863112.1 PREDICTED: uncharacterized protein LOC105559442 [Vollenhovia emeryi]XP_011863113.1 PREDICTED: uncharacterized protein LOC105559442 [Vollenhovia emeryi]